MTGKITWFKKVGKNIMMDIFATMLFPVGRLMALTATLLLEPIKSLIMLIMRFLAAMLDRGTTYREGWDEHLT